MVAEPRSAECGAIFARGQMRLLAVLRLSDLPENDLLSCEDALQVRGHQLRGLQ